MSPFGKKLKAWNRGASRRHAALVTDVVRILDCSRSSKFEYEAACRTGLRSGFCLDGRTWKFADDYAAAIVNEALRRLCAERPSWWQGQLEYADTDTSRGFCARRGCAKPIPIDCGSTNGYVVKYCSKFCAESAHAERQRKIGVRMDLASYLAMHAARSRATMEARARLCHHCGRHFLTRQTNRKFCSRACFGAAAVVHQECPCATCGKRFRPEITRHGLSKYCSRDRSLSFAGRTLQGERVQKPRTIDREELVKVARPNYRPFRRPTHRAV